jgi:hypothetical protein
MKSSEINAIYAAKVAEFLTAGYTINTQTMNGSQGEIAKIDFRKGNEVIRVLLATETIWGEHFRTADTIALTVGRCADERVINAKGFGRDAIIWNERLEVIEKRVFYRIGGRRDSDWYLEGKEGEKAMNLYYTRFHTRCEIERIEEARTRSKDMTTDAVKKIVLPAVRRHLGKPNLKASRIDKVSRTWKDGRFEYTVTTLGKNRVVLH